MKNFIGQHICRLCGATMNIVLSPTMNKEERERYICPTPDCGLNQGFDKKWYDQLHDGTPYYDPTKKSDWRS